jgi:phosphoribosylformylglycinamidine cyclo-ligase
MSIGDALLAPHRSYLRAIAPLLTRDLVKGMAHITGGGITENLPRVLPPGCSAVVDRRSWHIPAIFRLLQTRGSIADDEMFRAFNMGIGLIVACAAADRDEVLQLLADAGEPNAVAIGSVTSGDRNVRYVS